MQDPIIVNRRQFHRLGATAALSLYSRLASAGNFDYPWKLGVITDEVSPDLGNVLKNFVPKYQLGWVEIRDLKIDGKNKYIYKSATPEEIKDIRKQLDDAGVKLSILDTAFYKIPLPGTTPLQESATERNRAEGDFARQMDELKRAADAAHALGTKKLRIFDFSRVADPDSIFDRIVEELNKAIVVAKQHDVTLVLENEQSCNTATGTETAKLFKAVKDHTLMHNWDPGNCFVAGEEPFPKAWDMLDHKRITHVHLKDAEGKSWKPIGSGKVDFIGQFEALKKMKYASTLSLETHYRNVAHDAYASSVESMDGLFTVLKKV
jgi:sugar phosphate isomerase/epimerase